MAVSYFTADTQKYGDKKYEKERQKEEKKEQRMKRQKYACQKHCEGFVFRLYGQRISPLIVFSFYSPLKLKKIVMYEACSGLSGQTIYSFFCF